MFPPKGNKTILDSVATEIHVGRMQRDSYGIASSTLFIFGRRPIWNGSDVGQRAGEALLALA